jgi:hypothetical protein
LLSLSETVTVDMLTRSETFWLCTWAPSFIVDDGLLLSLSEAATVDMLTRSETYLLVHLDALLSPSMMAFCYPYPKQ